MVSFFHGRPDRKEYRRFHIRELGGLVDDYRAIREVVARRYTRVLNEGLLPPDLVLIDGGKGQVSSAVEVLAAIGLSGIPVVGLAKKLEELWLPGRHDPVVLPEGSTALRVLQYVRDEAHRFATAFNKGLRKKDVTTSALETIKGIGPKRARDLLLAFGSIAAIGSLDAEELAGKSGLPVHVARRVIAWCGKNG
jgi:excinuclease ABC subunit C